MCPREIWCSVAPRLAGDLSQDLEVTCSSVTCPAGGLASPGPGSSPSVASQVQCVECPSLLLPSPSRHAHFPRTWTDGSSECCGLSTRLRPSLHPEAEWPRAVSVPEAPFPSWVCVEVDQPGGECEPLGAGHMPPCPAALASVPGCPLGAGEDGFTSLVLTTVTVLAGVSRARPPLLFGWLLFALGHGSMLPVRLLPAPEARPAQQRLPVLLPAPACGHPPPA